MFLRFAAGFIPLVQLVALGALLLLLPTARILPSLPALGLLTASLVALVFYERFSGGEQDLTADETADV